MGSTRYYLFSSIYKWGKMYLEYHSVENKGETVTSSSFITCNLKIVFLKYIILIGAVDSTSEI